jgi:hypothetical protein
LRGFFDETTKFLVTGISVCEKTAQASQWAYTPGLLSEQYSNIEKYGKAIDYRKTSKGDLQTYKIQSFLGQLVRNI